MGIRWADYAVSAFSELSPCSAVAGVSAAAVLCSGGRCACRWVIVMDLCLRSSWTVLRSTPFIVSCLAAVWRYVVQDIAGITERFSTVPAVIFAVLNQWSPRGNSGPLTVDKPGPTSYSFPAVTLTPSGL